MRCIEARAVRAGSRIRLASEHRQRAPGIALCTRRVGDTHHRLLPADMGRIRTNSMNSPPHS